MVRGERAARLAARAGPPGLALLATLALAGVAAAQGSGTTPDVSSSREATVRLLALEPGKVFMYFFIMLGPLKLIGPFVRLTAGTEPAFQRRLAVRGFIFACIGGLVAAVLGQYLLERWSVSLPALLLAGGLVLLLVALQGVLHQYTPTGEPAGGPAAQHPPTLALALAPLAFPNIITPYGTAALILLLAASAEPAHELVVLGMFLAVMVIDLLAMLYAHHLLKLVSPASLLLLGAVLGVLQIALAIQILIAAGKLLGIVPD